MKIAIHHREGSFSNRWIIYCEKNNIPYKVVNAFADNIIQQLEDCNALMWHHHHAHYKDVLTAKRILFALEHAGIKVFPDFKTAWHFDDKVAQKYLLEAIDAPIVPSYVFYDKKQALDWAANISYPKVFKLKGGAGSANVKLVNTERETIRLINKAFAKGFAQFDRFANLKEKIRKFKEGKETFKTVLKGLARLFITIDFARQQAPERGYVYFQDFIPNLDSDIRIQIIGERVFGLKRFVRENDFRASGSGNFIEFNENNIDKNILKVALSTKQKTQAQCLTIDFIYSDDEPLIVELSYGFPVKFYDNCSGYWDSSMNWHEGHFNPQEWMIEDFINEISQN